MLRLSVGTMPAAAPAAAGRGFEERDGEASPPRAIFRACAAEAGTSGDIKEAEIETEEAPEGRKAPPCC
jgi:hypothetical protein